MASESQWVTFRVGGEVFGFEIQYVKEMLRMPDVHAVPHAADDNLGVILLRSEVIPVFDLRRKFGHPSREQAAAGLIELLRARQQDHENWLRELESSVKEEREFSLATDPHKCKFGMWYDQYQSEDAALARILKRFEEPHQRIHLLGAQVKENQAKGDYGNAAVLIQRARELVLTGLCHLFDEAIKHLEESARAGLVLVGTHSCTLGVAVDEIHAVMRCADDEIQPPDSIPGSENFGGLIGLLPIKGSHKFVMLLDPAQLYPQLIAPHKEMVTP
ncbi:MAG TPA: chemotaxis protein CheW [bacterium]|jgi:purine-binding chemotaxis protein CheW